MDIPVHQNRLDLSLTAFAPLSMAVSDGEDLIFMGDTFTAKHSSVNLLYLAQGMA
ncbi:MAG: hypothetical protein KZQ66_09425 [Candidatus Thiodiazotropha sp. (ex Lucinoma aequizonata)]|nr:hypothetical protein [Candidatus Thiodiazotropha sp. (ex Lucinoma aequizonata)]MCU7902188.1 hypothetical protein [Candidatus Thiodiazotropha sp. (ex Lucinoma aequizonata)]